VQFAERGDQPSLNQAISTLEQATGKSQPEILADLRRQPPDLVAAEQRLTAVLDALRSRADTADPQMAGAELHRILSMPRYARAAAGPPLWQQLLAWLLTEVGRWLGALGTGKLGIPPIVFVVLVVAALALLLVWLLRSAFNRGGKRASLRAAALAPQPGSDFFERADRLAAAGDYLAAIRALAGGVAVALGGERAWQRSPLTVREIFQRSRGVEGLRPLLLPFEAAVYGHRPPSPEAYGRAAEAAAPFRGKSG
jgi:hypothetical protein